MDVLLVAAVYTVEGEPEELEILALVSLLKVLVAIVPCFY
jgi:hypothetical protein